MTQKATCQYDQTGKNEISGFLGREPKNLCAENRQINLLGAVAAKCCCSRGPT
jgi:hypothetical protein